MKKYLAPSIEMNKFDVEDIITASGDFTTKDSLDKAAQAMYDEFIGAGNSEAGNVVGLVW